MGAFSKGKASNEEFVSSELAAAVAATAGSVSCVGVWEFSGAVSVSPARLCVAAVAVFPAAAAVAATARSVVQVLSNAVRSTILPLQSMRPHCRAAFHIHPDIIPPTGFARHPKIKADGGVKSFKMKPTPAPRKRLTKHQCTEARVAKCPPN